MQLEIVVSKHEGSLKDMGVPKVRGTFFGGPHMGLGKNPLLRFYARAVLFAASCKGITNTQQSIRSMIPEVSDRSSVKR